MRLTILFTVLSLAPTSLFSQSCRSSDYLSYHAEGGTTTSTYSSQNAPEDGQFPVVVERDPNPPYPSASCVEPMRLRNTDPNKFVRVTFSLTYRSVGPSCSPGEQVTMEQRTLGPGQTLYIGCTQFHFAGSFCFEERRWSVVSAEYVTN